MPERCFYRLGGKAELADLAATQTGREGQIGGNAECLT